MPSVPSAFSTSMVLMESVMIVASSKSADAKSAHFSLLCWIIMSSGCRREREFRVRRCIESLGSRLPSREVEQASKPSSRTLHSNLRYQNLVPCSLSSHSCRSQRDSVKCFTPLYQDAMTVVIGLNRTCPYLNHVWFLF